MRLARRRTGFAQSRRRGASINGAMKFHVNFMGKPRYRRSSKRPPLKEIDAPGGQAKLALDAPFG